MPYGHSTVHKAASERTLKGKNMARSDQLPIFIDTYQFVKELYHITHKFSREFKYCLGTQMNNNALQLLYHIFEANHTHDSKLPHLDAFLSEMDMVRVEMRLAHDMGVLTTRQMAHLSLFFDKIMKQANAWHKAQIVPKGKEESDKKDWPESNAMNKPSV